MICGYSFVKYGFCFGMALDLVNDSNLSSWLRSPFSQAVPTLRPLPRPYTGAKLNTQLDDQVRQWLSTTGLQIDRAQSRVQLSIIT
jgi:hypothetical protein